MSTSARSTIEAGGLRFEARSAGPDEGTPVLLLHGFPQTSRCWEPVLGPLAAAGYRAIAYDQRGYSPGARPAGVEHYATARFVDDVIAVADALGLDRFHLVGHDLGGAVAWTVAGTHPARLRTLTVASTPHPAAFVAAYAEGAGGSGPAGAASPGSGDQHERSGYIRAFKEAPRGQIEEALLADGGAGLRVAYAGLDEDAVADYLAVLSVPGALEAAVDWYRASRGSVSASTPPSPVPTLYVWGDEDPALGRGGAERTAEHVTGPYRFEVLAGAGHWIPELHAEAFVDLLLQHLASHPEA